MTDYVWNIDIKRVDEYGRSVAVDDADLMRLFAQNWAERAATVVRQQIDSNAVAGPATAKAMYQDLVGNLMSRLLYNLEKDHLDCPAISALFPKAEKQPIDVTVRLPEYQEVETELLRDEKGRARGTRTVRRPVLADQ